VRARSKRLRRAGLLVGVVALVLWIPLAAGQEWLALFAYLGGYAAATGRVARQFAPHGCAAIQRSSVAIPRGDTRL